MTSGGNNGVTGIRGGPEPDAITLEACGRPIRESSSTASSSPPSSGAPVAVTDAIFWQVPVVVIPGLRKPMVRRDDVMRLIAASTFDGKTRVRQ